MDSVRKKIFQNLEAALEGVQALRHRGFGLWIPDDPELGRKQQPSAAVLPIDENSEFLPDEIHVETLKVAIRVVVDQTHQHAGYELEDILGDVHRAVMADLTRGGLADDTRKLGTRWLFLDQTFPQAGADLIFEVKYQTVESDPS